MRITVPVLAAGVVDMAGIDSNSASGESWLAVASPRCIIRIASGAAAVIASSVIGL